MCLNGGKCIIDKSHSIGYKCLCLTNFIGPTCSFNINPCASNPCNSTSVCKNKGSTFECHLLSARFVNKLTTKFPFSQLILSQSKIELNYSVCLNDSPCKNGGDCKVDDKFEYICNCKFGYLGRNCEIMNHCLIDSNICKNEGLCQMIDNKPTCKCKQGFEPPYCEKPTNFLKITTSSNGLCGMNVCKNGGTCVHAFLNDNNLIGMKCLCKSNYSGIFCDKDISLEVHKVEKLRSISIPSICLSTNRTLINNEAPIRMVKLLHSNNSYYLIQNDLIWYMNRGIIVKDGIKWPLRLSELFLSIEDQIDSILYDYSNEEILIFKMDKYWKYKKT